MPNVHPALTLSCLGCVMISGFSLPPEARSARQDDAQVAVARQDSGQIVLAMDSKQGLSFRDFLKFAGQMTDKVFLVDWENDPSGGQDTPASRVVVESKLALTKEEFQQFFEAVLHAKGWAYVPTGIGKPEVVRILYQQGSKQMEIQGSARYVPLEELDDYRNRRATFVRTILALEHVNSQHASNLVRSATPSQFGANCLALPNGCVLVQGYGHQVRENVRLLKAMDLPESGR